MTDTDQNLTPPSPVNMLLKMTAQHALTAIAALLVAKGVIDKNQAGMWADLAFAVLLASGNFVWAVVRVYATRNHWFDALYSAPGASQAASAPTPSPGP